MTHLKINGCPACVISIIRFSIALDTFHNVWSPKATSVMLPTKVECMVLFYREKMGLLNEIHAF